MKFKVGDRVKKIGGSHIGEIGTVKKVGRYDYEVEFDNRIPNGHVCSNTCEPGYGWFCMGHDLELVKPEHNFKVGDIVKGKPSSDDVYSITNSKMTKGRVERVRRDGDDCYIGVCVLEHLDWSGDTVFSVNAKHFELVNEKPESIVIYQKNETVVAKNTATGEKAVAKCHPDDEFDFKTGATVAFDRLMGREVEKPKFIEKFEEGKTYIFSEDLHDAICGYAPWTRECDGKTVEFSSSVIGRIGCYMIVPRWCKEVTEEPKKFTGKIICVEETSVGNFKKGKIYEVVDGNFKSDMGYETFKWNAETKTSDSDSKFIEIVGEVEPPKKEEYYNGKVVCTKGIVGLTTKGKIYEFKDGRLTYDDGSKSTSDGIHTFEDVCCRFASNFIELHEDKPELYNGKVVCVERYNSFVTKGKVYQFENGLAIDDVGDPMPFTEKPIKDVGDLNKRLSSDFIEVVE